MNNVRAACVRAFLFVLTASCAAATIAVGPAAISTVSTPANAALDSAYRRGDAAAAAALMTDSVIISAEGIPDLVGRKTMRDLMGQFFAANTVTAFTLQPTELRLYGSYAFERGTFIWSAGAKGATPTTRNGRYTILRLREADGAWRIHRYLENCLPAPCP
jgi:uncharacterized protein (TIGR02246 family)